MFMPRMLLPTILLVLAIGLSAGLAPQAARPAKAAATFKVDPVHSTAIFRVKHLGAGNFYGRFNDVTGTFAFNGETADDLAFDITIPIASVDSGNASLDEHLKSADFFHAEEHPDMRFRSTSAKKLGEGRFELAGDLAIRGVTRPITVTMHWTGTADFGRGYRCGFETTFTIKRSDFGVMYGVSNGAVGDETKIIIALEGVRE